MATRNGPRTWRRFRRGERYTIEQDLAVHGDAVCPACGGALIARPSARLAAALPTGAHGSDMECRTCHRFHSRIQHTPNSLYLLRIQRLAAAVLRA